MLSKLPPIFRNFYFVTALAFFVWMLFFDANDFISQWRMGSKKDDLEEVKEFYEEKIAEVKQDREELFSSPELLEKFAREKYLMKKPGEDVYIIEKAD